MICPLCQSHGQLFYNHKRDTYYDCMNCRGLFRPQEHFPNDEAERSRYLEHNNDVNDKKYQQFVSPVVQAVINNYGPEHIGLDFGAGTGPVVSCLLEAQDYIIKKYDPFFHNHPELLEQRYDYIVCCEVIEHFHHPAKEFELLKELLYDGGKIFCMTHIYDNSIDFSKWYYKNDPTHVFIYRRETLEYIAKRFSFSRMNISERLIVFEK